ncbi:MAG TPA: hypothetical protein VID75_08525 [Acidimicrobiales bacterium]|jgi:hypothetical protein
MAGKVETFSFLPDDAQIVVERMDSLGASHRGWINVVPEVREEDQPDPAIGLGTLFTGIVHEIPICTWAAGKEGRRGIEPDTLGIQHNTGTKVVARLATLDVPIPPRWRWMQDHPRRGLVVLVPLDVGHADQLTWLLRAGAVLSTVPLTGRWEARVRWGR